MVRWSNTAIVSLFFVFATGYSGVVTVDAAVITDPALMFGANAIDPLAPDANAGVLDATRLVAGAAAKADLTSITDFGVVQSFNGFTGRATQGAGAGVPAVNFFSFTDPDRPDVRISSLSGNASGGGGDSNASTSGGASPPPGTTDQYLGSNVTNGGFTQTIEFGTYNTGDDTFSPDQGVSSVGFMITRINNVATNWTATFFDTNDTVLSTQTTGVLQGTASEAVLFGYVSGSADIRRVHVVFQGAVNTFMDDLGFGTMPGPPQIPNPFAKVPQLNNFNGSFEDTSAGAGAPTSNLNGSNGSFDAYDANFLDITGWDPYFEDPNNVVGRYGPTGFLTDNSFYLDTLSGSGGGSDGTRRLTLNSVDGYVNGIVNEDVLAGIDSRFLNPNVQLKFVVDVAQGNTSIAGNTNATTTVALTDGVGTAASDLSNAIASASVQQSTLPLGVPSTQLEFSLTGADLVGASQLNLLVQSVNTNSTSGESPPGLDASKGSQVFLDDVRVLAFLPGDADGDFDVDGDDLIAWQSNYGGTALSFAQGDFDLDGDADGSDFLVWQRNFTGSLPSLFSSVASVPEPNSLMLVMIGFGLIYCQRRS